MAGMNRNTGQELDGFEHVSQSIQDIITTPLGTRVYRRDYGSSVPDLIDRPGTLGTLLEYTIAIGEAIDRWEPRYRLNRCWFEEAGNDGVFLINMDGTYFPRSHLGDFETGLRRGIEVPFPVPLR